jgi:hypothetical protein
MSLELKKSEVELIKVQAAKADLELKIMERLEEIDRMRNHIEMFLKKELELTSQIKNLKGSE